MLLVMFVGASAVVTHVAIASDSPGIAGLPASRCEGRDSSHEKL